MEITMKKTLFAAFAVMAIAFGSVAMLAPAHAAPQYDMVAQDGSAS
jgi:hypothetical protein